MRLPTIFATLLVLSGCAPTQFHKTGELPPIVPTFSVEKFLQASNERDLHAMARLFGDEDGPVMRSDDPVGCAFKKVGSWIGLGDRCPTLQEVELEMDLIAEILAHEAYHIGPEVRVAGRESPTVRLDVDLTIRGRNYPQVPFTVVRHEGRWLIEQIDLERVTSSR